VQTSWPLPAGQCRTAAPKRAGSLGCDTKLIRYDCALKYNDTLCRPVRSIPQARTPIPPRPYASSGVWSVAAAGAATAAMVAGDDDGRGGGAANAVAAAETAPSSSRGGGGDAVATRVAVAAGILAVAVVGQPEPDGVVVGLQLLPLKRSAHTATWKATNTSVHPSSPDAPRSACISL
jgi:hypothetical protein